MFLIIAASVCVIACQKKTEQPITTLNENISRKELSGWMSNYLKMIPDGPIPLLDKATKTYYKGQMIVKIPLSSGGGHFYFTKKDRLDVQFIRVVSSNVQLNKFFSGYYEFIDMNTFAYQVINFKAGSETNRVKHGFSQPNIALGVIKRNSGEGGYYEGSWFGAFIHCITNYLIAIPKPEGSGWRCYGPGSVENATPGDAGGSIFDWPTWFLTNPPLNYNLPPGPSSPWQYYDGNAGYYDPINTNLYYPPSISNNPSDPNISQSLTPTDFVNELGYYSTFSQQEIDSYYSTLEKYWLSNTYDLIYPYDPLVDGSRDSNGFRKNGPSITYTDGIVQNYTDDNGNKYAIFTDINGIKISFPGVTITDFGVIDRAGVTTPNGGIYLSTIGNGLVDIQHEYGHYLHAIAIGTVDYMRLVVPASLYSAFINSSNHRFTWTEIVANRLSSLFFGPNSKITLSTYYPKS